MTSGEQAALGRFRLFVVAGWVVLGAVAFIYARFKGLALSAAAPVAVAFLLEFPLYVAPGVAGLTSVFRAVKKENLAWFMAATAMLPWTFYAALTGEFNLARFVLLLAIIGVVAFWYILWPASPAADVVFLAILAFTMISKAFDLVYASPLPRVPVSILGHIMLIRVAAMAILFLRGKTGVEFRFVPRRDEWFRGLRYFAMLMPVAGLAYWALGLAELRTPPQNVAIAVGTFFGILWVVALSEEFFFRGLVLPWLTEWTGSATFALVATSLLFGSVHLGFRFHGGFPNWRFATVAAVAGIFYGLAARRAGNGVGIQASMVTHALTVTAWRVFLH